VITSGNRMPSSSVRASMPVTVEMRSRFTTAS